MGIGDIVSAVLTGMSSFFSYVFNFVEHPAVATVCCLPIIGGIVARVASLTKRSKG